MAEDEIPVTEDSIDVSTLPESEQIIQALPGDHVHVHSHPEHTERVEQLEARCAELERKLTELDGKLKRAREDRPEDDHFWFRKIGDKK